MTESINFFHNAIKEFLKYHNLKPRDVFRTPEISFKNFYVDPQDGLIKTVEGTKENLILGEPDYNDFNLFLKYGSEIKIIKDTFRPVDGEIYYYIKIVEESNDTASLNVKEDIFNSGSFICQQNYLSGNCFRTKEEINKDAYFNLVEKFQNDFNNYDRPF